MKAVKLKPTVRRAIMLILFVRIFAGFFSKVSKCFFFIFVAFAVSIRFVLFKLVTRTFSFKYYVHYNHIYRLSIPLFLIAYLS